MKTKKTTQDVIMTTKYLASASDKPEEIVKSICISHILTQDFIREFSQYITPEVFMTSYKLSKTLADNNPHLFDEEQFKELMKYKEEEVVETEEERLKNKLGIMNNHLSSFMSKNGGNFITGAQLGQLASAIGDPDEARKVITNNLKNISLSMLCYYYNDFKDNDEYRLTNDDILKIVREATEEDLNDEAIISLMGISSKIDELLLMRIKDEDTKSSILLTLSLSDDHEMTSSSYKHLSNDIKEEMLGDEDVSVSEFIKALAETKDLGWQTKMIQKAIKKEIQLAKTGEVLDRELTLLFASLPEDLIVQFIVNLNVYMPNTFSYKVMTWVLENKDFSELQLVSMKDVFKRAGLYFNLKRHAQDNNYTILIDALKK